MQNLKDGAFSIAEYFIPILKKSKFLENGVITPDEFVIAGDYLVHCFPTWKWCSGDISKHRDYLPSEKQYLVTKNVPCLKRCDEIDINENPHTTNLASDNGIDNDWVIAGSINRDKIVSAIDEIDINKPPNMSNTVDDSESDDIALDMEEVMESGLIDTMTIVKQPSTHTNIQNSIIYRRTYDLHITYDKYYQTPRLWLQGYDKDGQPLTINQIYEDISEDHIEKTVTMSTHPHLPLSSMATVHPCKHADVMKNLLLTFQSNNQKINVHMYLVIFLKFMQSVLPTIEYDYTRGFEFK